MYELNSLKLILDCLVDATAALLRARIAAADAGGEAADGADGADAGVLAALLQHTAQTLASFTDGDGTNNKGRSVVQVSRNGPRKLEPTVDGFSRKRNGLPFLSRFSFT